MTKAYKGDVGTLVVLDCGTDVTAATARSVAVRKPDGSTTSWTASASGTTAIQYTIDADDLDQSGEWRLQAVVTIGATVWRGETARLQVYPAFG